MARGKNRRKKYLISKRFQLQFSGVLIIQVAIPIVILGVFICLLNNMYLTTLQKIVGEGVISNSDIQNILGFFISTMAAFLVVASILLTLMGVRISHRIMGPLFRIEENMAKILRGKKVEAMHFRKNDNIDSFADTFNEIIEKLDGKIK